jgi:LuxR family maltose regulon positive regulatory protein
VTSKILTTKLFIPSPRSNLVARQRLLEGLEAGVNGKLTLVSAPAGYGKSTLLSEWAHHTATPVIWLSLDAEDNNPSRFWVYFVAALRIIPFLEDLGVGDNFLRTLETQPIPDREMLLEELVATLAAIPEPFVLILDDLQLVSEPQILDGIFYLLERIPEGMSGFHLIVSSRSDPPWPLARLRVRNQVTELRARDLRFTPDEAARFLKEVMQLALSLDQIAELDRRTEGWVAGLQMAALSIKGREDITGFLEGFTGGHRFVLDYLVEEVLRQQTPEVLDFLLKTSILERLTGGLCTAVTEDETSSEILLELEKANMFLEALDDQRNWYRYHHLFADLLQKQLQTRDLDSIPVLHRQASQWYEQAGFIPEAVAHALKTGDYDFAAIQIEAHVMELIQRGEMTLVGQWMSALPEAVVRTRPVLCVAQAWSSAKYATRELAEDLLAQAETTLSTGPSPDGNLDPGVHQLVSSQIAVLQVVISRMREDPTTRQRELALEALDHIDPVQDPASQATLYFRLGLCYLDLGADEQADRTFSQVIDLGQSSGNYYAANSASYARMVIARRHGQLHQLDAVCQAAQDSMRIRDSQPQSLAGIALTILGGVNYEWNNLDEAERNLIEGLKLIENFGLIEIHVKGYFTLACVKIAQDKVETLPDLINQAALGSPGLLHYTAALQAFLDFQLGQKSSGTSHAKAALLWAETQELTLRDQSTYDWEIPEKLIYARILSRAFRTHKRVNLQARLAEVLDFLATQRGPLEKLDWRGILFELDVVMAMVLRTLERNEAALDALRQALAFAETQGFVRTFLDEGQPMRELLQLALARGIHPGYTRELLATFDGQTQPTQTEPSHQPADLLDSLSERELQVLRLLNTRLNVPEIAAEIYLAPTTVRTYVQNIYRKLGVHGRVEALQRAKELGLL